MEGLLRSLSHGSRAASYLLGGLVLVTAAVALLLSRDFSAIAGWALDVLGAGFLLLLGALIFAGLYGLVRMHDEQASRASRAMWFEVGLQAANGVTTLALTFTLLGISLGIGSLAGQTLTPETVQSVLRDLTAHFSLAFMTTVVGLPVSAAMRAVLAVSSRRLTDEALPERTAS